MLRRRRDRTGGAIRMGLLLGLVSAALLAIIVGVLGYTTNQEVTDIFDRSARDSRELAVDTVSRFAKLRASTTAITVQPFVIDHNYSDMGTVLRGMTTRDTALLYIGVFDADGKVVKESGTRTVANATVMGATAPITSQGMQIGAVELQYSMTGVDTRIRQAQETNRERRTASIRKLIIGGVVILGFGVLFAAAFGMWLSRPVTRMAHAAGKLGEGQFDVRVEVGGPAEFRKLATTFNSMAGDLEASISASIEQAALEREVATARRLQREMMPPEDRVVVGDLEIASWYAPAGKMGGDWWTVTEPENGRPITIMIGDVIGHGIPAALFTAAAKTAYRTAGILDTKGGPHDILTTLDQALRGFSHTHTMSCVAAHFDLASEKLVLSIGAHPAPLRFRGGDTPAMKILDGQGPLIGDPDPGAGFSSSSHDFGPGDLLVLFTDGVIEATDDRKRMFGLRRLAASIERDLDGDLESILETLKKAFHDYVSADDVDDDVTVVLVRYMPREDRASA